VRHGWPEVSGRVQDARMAEKDFDGKVIVVTGSSRGIGKGLATYLGRLGASRTVLAGVECVSTTNCTAVGEFAANSNPFTLVEHYS
jgi:hypothetical protein